MKNRKTIKFISLFLPLPLIVLSLLVGPSDKASPKAIFFWALKQLPFFPQSPSSDDMLIKTILIDVRLPRVILSFIVGGALTISGGSLQAIFRNPLVDSYILGISAGAAFGAALAVAFNIFSLQLLAFIFAIIAFTFSVTLSSKEKTISTVSLILSGIIVNGIFTALLTVVQFITDPFKLQTIVHWTMGNLHNSSWEKVKSGIIPMLCGSFGLMILSWQHNLLALGDEETSTSGLNPLFQKLIILFFATLAASGAVSVAGIIGFIGLVIPHMARIIIGPDNHKMLPFSFIAGGSFLLLIDTISRTLTSFEIPIGIFTMLIGGPLFIFLLRKSKIGWDL